MNAVNVAPLELSEAAATPPSTTSTPKRDLSLVGHVPVRLDALIGSCEMPVAQLMALSAGDVVSLLAGLDEPITLRLNDKPIARGELVAVGEQFGVRITEVL